MLRITSTQIHIIAQTYPLNITLYGQENEKKMRNV